MRNRTWYIALILTIAQAAHAQEPPRVVRQISPDRFQPNLRDTIGAQVAPVAVVPPSKEHPLGACDRTSHNWASCLRDTAELSNAMVDSAESQLAASLGHRSNISASFQGVLGKYLADADAKWRELRDVECSQLAMLEVGAGKQLYESRMICQMMHNAARIDALANQYGRIDLNAANVATPR
jgi:hypothetical protein